MPPSRPATSAPIQAFLSGPTTPQETLAQFAKLSITPSSESILLYRRSTATKAQSPPIQRPSMLLAAGSQPPASVSDPRLHKTRSATRVRKQELPSTPAASANRPHATS